MPLLLTKYIVVENWLEKKVHKNCSTMNMAFCMIHDDMSVVSTVSYMI